MPQRIITGKGEHDLGLAIPQSLQNIGDKPLAGEAKLRNSGGVLCKLPKGAEPGEFKKMAPIFCGQNNHLICVLENDSDTVEVIHS